MNKQVHQRGTAKERIIEVAGGLFYKQGYNATGIQQIIDEAGVSKGTFYTHFKCKDDLGVDYMRNQSSREMAEIKEALSAIKDPYQRYLQFNQIMKQWMISTDYRGCPFANMAAEAPDCKCAFRKEAKFHYEAFRAIIRDMVKDLVSSDKKYMHLDAEYVGDQFMIIEIGAMINTGIYQDTWPYDHADRAVRELIGEKG